MSENIMYKNIADKMKAQQERIEYLERSNNRREDTIMGLRNELGEAEDSITWWNNRYNALQRDYEDYKSRCEKAIEYLKSKESSLFMTYSDDMLDHDELIDKKIGTTLLNILNGKE